MSEVNLGDVVCSLKGRDTGCYYIVKNFDNNYAYLIDGKGKEVNNPKKKKFKHFRKININVEILADKFKNGKQVLDAEVRKYLRNISES